MLGSVLYLLGTALLYGRYGTLDIALLSGRVQAEPASLLAAALMTTGLLAKTALFPLHLWLPPAHAGAPAAASAILSGLVVKGSFFIIVRFWFQVMPALPGLPATQLLAALGAAAIVSGSILALRQERLKLLIAYSTVAQIGYLFLMFPLALEASGKLEDGKALAGGLLQAVSHATAKAAMFMAAGSIYARLGHDRITGFHGLVRTMPLSVLAFALAGIALIGIQPSGASLAKELLLRAAADKGQWWWAVVLEAGGMFTAAYVVLVLAHAMAPTDEWIASTGSARHARNMAALVLALCSLLLGLLAWDSYLPIPYDSTSRFLAAETLTKTLFSVLGGVVLAILLAPWPHPHAYSTRWKIAAGVLVPFQRSCHKLGGCLARGDRVLCQWPAASIFLLVLVLLFGALMVGGHTSRPG
ncbi:proton-conducting transporter membrane subunit [Bradyrhizobium sp. SSUT77]|uniref:complex I subunit 5 family protein n=1 Tax=Bradyrhizobium sp. SSUT77 TaxID=3040603 RepID=UPI00244951EE|nr:proton-conducting transporter membrane subunit [Bradyrhizobium sp. SSUT77]MDH2349006.1 proton-conducting transporter membrane subunit [Bradyrhizobium sp. SSUT77]